jgi:hypothetical protein
MLLLSNINDKKEMEKDLIKLLITEYQQKTTKVEIMN